MGEPWPPGLVVGSRLDAECFALEVIRNFRLAHPGSAVSGYGLEGWSRIATVVDGAAGLSGLAVIGGEIQKLDVSAGSFLILPGASVETPSNAPMVRLELGEPIGEVILVPGTAKALNGHHVITEEAIGRLRHAEGIARRRSVRMIILSGWNGPGGRGESEALQLMKAWNPSVPVPLVLDEAARTTAENALCSAELVGAAGHVRQVILVASWVNALRAWLATVIAYRKKNISVRVSVLWGRPHAASWRPGLVGLLYLRRHIRGGREFLSRVPLSG